MAGQYVIQSSQIFFPGSTQDALLQVGPLTFGVTTPILQTNSLTFGSGTFITTSGPTGATTCLIIMPAANTVSVTLKGITGDTGIALSPTGIAFLTFPVNTTPAVGLTSGAQITAGPITLIWA